MSSTPEPARPAPRPDADLATDLTTDTTAVTPATVSRRVVPRRTPVASSGALPGPAAPAAAAVVPGDVPALGPLLLVEHSTTSVLQEVAELARAGVPGVAEASVTLVERERVSSVAWTGLLAYELDEAQYASGEGPCVDAARTGVPRWVQDTREDRRWPAYLSAAVRHGALSSFSVPLPLPAVEDVRVGVNLYSTSADGLSESAREAAVELARQVGTTVANQHAYDRALGRVEHLGRAMESRAVIEQAKGVLSAALAVTADEAFRALSRRSQDTNVRLHDLAAQLMQRVAAGDGRDAVAGWTVPPPGR